MLSMASIISVCFCCISLITGPGRNLPYKYTFSSDPTVGYGRRGPRRPTPPQSHCWICYSSGFDLINGQPIESGEGTESITLSANKSGNFFLAI
jgi:hypothetical protein